MAASTFAGLWRLLFGAAAVFAVLAVAGGIVSTGSWPAWTFALALLLLVAGAASLTVRATLAARRAIDDLIDDDTPPTGTPAPRTGPSGPRTGPTGPKTGPR
ncbi:hypothetical protein ABB55_27390 [Prosthecomicrobium hirschii]|uniref:Uncharacterized protein n=1 Tax=Prosthecodimorpha hirschii TaxID=665126 RepID=A0A0P6WAA7_9HYPH|nr:hypothetical protein [Prosthecomicrobium hirschii]KPL55501.1 hypothetical protein ABB55_27390 [Prosthecomicrobium hirschii]